MTQQEDKSNEHSGSNRRTNRTPVELDLAKATGMTKALQAAIESNKHLTDSFSQAARMVMPPISNAVLEAIKSIQLPADMTKPLQIQQIMPNIAVPSSALQAITNVASIYTDFSKTLLKGISFPALEVAKTLPYFSDWQELYTSLFSSIASQAAELVAKFDTLRATNLDSVPEKWWSDFPANLRAVPRTRDYDWLTEVLLVEGIALFRVPSPAVITSFIQIPTPQGRRAWLGKHLSHLAADCERIVIPHRTGPAKDIAHFLESAIHTVRNGNHEAAQALLSNLIDSMVGNLNSTLNHLITKQRATSKSHPQGQTIEDRADELEDYSANDWLALVPLLKTYKPFWPDKGDPVPKHFSRHASTHFVVRKQFTRPNTAQALLCATSLAAYLYEWPDPDWSSD